MTNPSAFDQIIEETARRHGVDPALLRAMIQQESGFNPRAVSPAGAQGLMQLMPGTAREMGVRNPFDPAQNIEGGAKYFSNMQRMFPQDLALALAAYNAGPGKVQRAGGAIPNIPETQDYVRKIFQLYKGKRSPFAAPSRTPTLEMAKAEEKPAVPIFQSLFKEAKEPESYEEAHQKVFGESAKRADEIITNMFEEARAGKDAGDLLYGNTLGEELKPPDLRSMLPRATPGQVARDFLANLGRAHRMGQNYVPIQELRQKMAMDEYNAQTARMNAISNQERAGFLETQLRTKTQQADRLAALRHFERRIQEENRLLKTTYGNEYANSVLNLRQADVDLRAAEAQGQTATSQQKMAYMQAKIDQTKQALITPEDDYAVARLLTQAELPGVPFTDPRYSTLYYEKLQEVWKAKAAGLRGGIKTPIRSFMVIEDAVKTDLETGIQTPVKQQFAITYDPNNPAGFTKTKVGEGLKMSEFLEKKIGGRSTAISLTTNVAQVLSDALADPSDSKGVNTVFGLIRGMDMAKPFTLSWTQLSPEANYIAMAMGNIAMARTNAFTGAQATEREYERIKNIFVPERTKPENALARLLSYLWLDQLEIIKEAKGVDPRLLFAGSRRTAPTTKDGINISIEGGDSGAKLNFITYLLNRVEDHIARVQAGQNVRVVSGMEILKDYMMTQHRLRYDSDTNQWVALGGA